MRNRLVIGTRKSALALWQSEYVKARLQAVFPGLSVELKHVITAGDKNQNSASPIPLIGGKGLFTAELEECLRTNEIDLAVHSLKDLPTQLDPHFVVGAVPKRSYVEDVVVSRSGCSLAELPQGACVGTSSVRRASQILRMRPDIKIRIIRGNVDTRLRKLRDAGGEYDAIILARAGLSRLGLEKEITHVMREEEMLPAPGQGALGIECRSDDTELLEMLQKLHDPDTAAEVAAERVFLHRLGAGCNTPVAALAKVSGQGENKTLSFQGRCLSPDGSKVIEVSGEASAEDALKLGERMADEVSRQGFNEIAKTFA
jgi:hydroxymethylbilane synthase